MSPSILLADDDPGVRDVVSYAFRNEGFDIDVVADGEAALAEARARDYDVLILDVMMPGPSGIDVCRELRTESSVPVVMLTAKDAEVDRVLGLELGADDYVTKPFSLAELVSRVRALLRRRDLERSEPGGTLRRVGGLELDLGRHRVRVDGRTIQLTLSEFKVAALLAERPEHVFTRRQVMQHLWQSDYVGDEHACDVHVSNLRRKVEPDPSRPTRIVTVRGLGYKLMPV